MARYKGDDEESNRPRRSLKLSEEEKSFVADLQTVAMLRARPYFKMDSGDGEPHDLPPDDPAVLAPLQKQLEALQKKEGPRMIMVINPEKFIGADYQQFDVALLRDALQRRGVDFEMLDEPFARSRDGRQPPLYLAAVNPLQLRTLLTAAEPLIEKIRAHEKTVPMKTDSSGSNMEAREPLDQRDRSKLGDLEYSINQLFPLSHVDRQDARGADGKGQGRV